MTVYRNRRPNVCRICGLRMVPPGVKHCDECRVPRHLGATPPAAVAPRGASDSWSSPLPYNPGTFPRVRAASKNRVLRRETE